MEICIIFKKTEKVIFYYVNEREYLRTFSLFLQMTEKYMKKLFKQCMKRSKMVHKTRFKRKKSHDHEKNQSKKYNVVYKKYLVREGLYRI